MNGLQDNSKHEALDNSPQTMTVLRLGPVRSSIKHFSTTRILNSTHYDTLGIPRDATKAQIKVRCFSDRLWNGKLIRQAL